MKCIVSKVEGAHPPKVTLREPLKWVIVPMFTYWGSQVFAAIKVPKCFLLEYSSASLQEPAIGRAIQSLPGRPSGGIWTFV